MSRAFKNKVNKAFNKIAKLIAIVIMLIAIVALIYAQNNVTFAKEYIYESNKVPKTFVGYTIAHISDVSNKPNGFESVVNDANPDLVIVTGNFTDADGDYKQSIKAIKSIASKYKTLYVLGESDLSVIADLNEELRSAGAINIESLAYEIQAPSITYDEFVAEFIEDRYVEQAQDASTEAYAYLQYTYNKLNSDTDKTIVISGFPVMNDDDDFTAKAYNFIDLEYSKLQIVAMNQSQYINKLSQVKIDAILSGNTFGKNTGAGFRRGVYSVNGKTAFVSGGVGDPIDGGIRIMNFPSVNIITLSDGTINTDNPLEKFLNKYNSKDETRFEKDQGFLEYRVQSK